MIGGIIALVVGHFLGAAINPTFIKVALREIPPFMFTALRFIIAAAVFYPIHRRLITKKLHFTHKAQLIKYSLFHSANILLYAVGIAYTTAIVSLIFYSFTPIVVGLLSHYFSHEKLTKHQVIGAGVALLGVFFLLLKSYNETQVNALGTPLGNILVFLAGVSLGFYYFFSRRLLKEYSPMTLSLTSYLLTGALSIFLIPFDQVIYHSNPHFSPVGILSLLAVGVLGTALMMYLAQYGIKHTNAFIGSVFIYLGPFFVSVTAIPILGEKVTLELVFGGALILIGVFVATDPGKLLPKKWLSAIQQLN